MENAINKADIKSHLYTILATAITILGIFIPLFSNVLNLTELGKVFFTFLLLSIFALTWLIFKPLRDIFFVERKELKIKVLFGSILFFGFCFFLEQIGCKDWWYLLSVVFFLIPFGIFEIGKQIITLKQSKIINKKYDNSLEILPKIQGYSLLKEYHNNVFEIEKSSHTDNKKNMTHLLYHMMNQHAISFIELCKSSNAGKIGDAFAKSIDLFRELKGDNSYAWFSNMKLPKSFAQNDAVIKYYKDFLDSFNDDNKNIEIRRIHLLYKNYLTDDKYMEQCTNLFQILLVEYFMQIKSKVLVVKDFEQYEYMFFHFTTKDIDIYKCRGYLLDFALFYRELKEEEKKDIKLFDNYKLLFADFCFEKKNEPINNFNDQSVYCVNDYNSFHVLKGYYLSLWEKDRYLIYLRQDKTFRDIEGGIKKEISETINLYEQLEILTFFDFWDRASNNIDFNKYDTFQKLYSWDKFLKNNSDESIDNFCDLKDKLFCDLKQFHGQYCHEMSKKSTVEKFANKFKNYYLRNKES